MRLFYVKNRSISIHICDMKNSSAHGAYFTQAMLAQRRISRYNGGTITRTEGVISMKASWKLVRHRLRLFDHTGLDSDQIRQLQVFIYSVMGGVVFGNITTGAAMASYMEALGANEFVYGIVIALPQLANAFQFALSYWMERTLKRKEMLIISGLIQRGLWIPFALVPLIIPMQHAQLRLWITVLLAVVSACMGPALNVSFYSLFNDVIPMRIRGRYLATRSKVSTIVGMVMGVITGILLDALPVYTNYMVVFMIAAVFGLFDIICYLTCKFPEMAPSPSPPKLWPMMKAVLTDKKYMRMVLSLTCWFFSVQLCAPFLTRYAFKVMGMTNTEVILSGQIMYNVLLILVVSRWGRAMDEYGNKPVFVMSTLLTSFMPLFWTRMGPGMLPLVALSNAYSGATYCAVDLSSQNLFMSQAPEKNRSMYFAVYFMFTQLFGLFLGSTVGGFMLDNVLGFVDNMNIMLAGVAFTRYNALFVLSSILRLLTVILLLTQMKVDSPRHTIELAQAMVRAPLGTYHQLVYRIKRWHLRKKYDKERLQEEQGEDT